MPPPDNSASTASENIVPRRNFAQLQNMAVVCWNSRKNRNKGASMMASVMEISAMIAITDTSMAGPLWPSRPAIWVRDLPSAFA